MRMASDSVTMRATMNLEDGDIDSDLELQDVGTRSSEAPPRSSARAAIVPYTGASTGHKGVQNQPDANTQFKVNSRDHLGRPARC